MIKPVNRILDMRDKLDWAKYKEELRKRKTAPIQLMVMPPIELDPNSVWKDATFDSRA